MTNTLEEMLLSQDEYNLVLPKGLYPRGQFASCANLARWDRLPYGCDVVATTDALGDSQEEIKGYIVHQKQIDIGGGNYLIARWCEKPDSDLRLSDIDVALPIPAPANSDGPACRCGYFEEWVTIQKYGFLNRVSWKREKEAERINEGFAELAALRGTLVFLLGKDQLSQFKEYLLDPLGWNDKEVFRSSLIHNRAHADTGNTLTLIVLQIKD